MIFFLPDLLQFLEAMVTRKNALSQLKQKELFMGEIVIYECVLL